MATSDDFQQQKYQLYLEERRHLIDAAREGARSFDKAILTLASGAFGFSIVALREVVPNPDPHLGWMLGASWALLALSLLVSLVSYLLSLKACHFEIDCAEAVMNDQEIPDNPWSRWTRIANYTSVTALSVGVVFWGLFVYAHLFWRN